MVTKEQIEKHLLGLPGDGWISSKKLAAFFGFPNDRKLRKTGNEPGLATEFTISGNKGLKHIDRATPREFDEYYARERGHNLEALVTLRQKRERRTQATKTVKKPALTMEKDTNQVLLFNLPTTDLPF